MNRSSNRSRVATGYRHPVWFTRTRVRIISRRLIACLLLASLLLGIGAPLVHPLLAQQIQPFLQITQVDTSGFPNIKVAVYGEGVDGGLESAELTVQEDGVTQRITQSEFPVVGSQLLIAIDSSANIMGDLKAPITTAIQELTSQQYLAAEKDWLAFISFDHSGAQAVPQVIEPWNVNDHGKVINGVVTYNPANPKTTTPLNELLRAGILYFDDTGSEGNPPDNLTRSLVIFTDGFNPLTVTEKQDIYREAEERGVRIHPVQLESRADSTQFLQNMAQTTNGIYTSFSASGSRLDALWQAYQQTQKQRVLTYRTSRPNPRQVTVSVSSASGRALSVTNPIPPIPIAPPVVTITEPSAGELTRVLPDGQEVQYDTPATELEPKSVQIGVDVSFPDGYSRNITRIEYSIGERIVTESDEPSTTVNFPIETLEGEQVIRVRATDELGLVSEQATKPLNIAVARGAPPDLDATATHVAAENEARTQALETAQAERLAVVQATQEAERIIALTREASIQGELASVGIVNTRLTLATAISGALALFAIGLAAYVWFNPRARRAATEFVQGAYATVTQIWKPDEGMTGAANSVVRARLSYVGGAQSPQQDLDLYGGGTRLGRDPVLSNTVINDHRVSRYHCRISEETDGSFVIRDEGSTSGTYVNQEQVSMSGRALKPGDLINIGPVQYRFEPLVGAFDTPTEIGTTGGMFMETEPYQFDGTTNDDNAFYDASSTEISTVAYGEYEGYEDQGEDAEATQYSKTTTYQDAPTAAPTQLDDENATKI